MENANILQKSLFERLKVGKVLAGVRKLLKWFSGTVDMVSVVTSFSALLGVSPLAGSTLGQEYYERPHTCSAHWIHALLAIND